MSFMITTPNFVKNSRIYVESTKKFEAGCPVGSTFELWSLLINSPSFVHALTFLFSQVTC